MSQENENITRGSIKYETLKNEVKRMITRSKTKLKSKLIQEFQNKINNINNNFDKKAITKYQLLLKDVQLTGGRIVIRNPLTKNNLTAAYVINNLKSISLYISFRLGH